MHHVASVEVRVDARPGGNATVEDVICVKGGAHLACGRAHAAKVFGTAGIDGTKTATVVGHPLDPSAFRVAWTLVYFGHRDVRIAVSYDRVERAPPAAFEPRVDGTVRIMYEQIEQFRGKLVDARFSPEFVAGHIPGATSIPFTEGLERDGLLKAAPDLEEMFLGYGLQKADEIACYCAHGHRAAALFFQLRSAGYKSVRLYDGSYVEWALRSASA